MRRPIRLVTAVPICDGHDSAINTLNIEFIRHGLEVVYLGFHRSASDIARAAVQEGVAAVGISSYNGGHIEFFRDVRKDLSAPKMPFVIGVMGIGGLKEDKKPGSQMYFRQAQVAPVSLPEFKEKDRT